MCASDGTATMQIQAMGKFCPNPFIELEMNEYLHKSYLRNSWKKGTSPKPKLVHLRVPLSLLS